jgi:hypothetical protein
MKLTSPISLLAIAMWVAMAVAGPSIAFGGEIVTWGYAGDGLGSPPVGDDFAAIA